MFTSEAFSMEDTPEGLSHIKAPVKEVVVEQINRMSRKESPQKGDYSTKFRRNSGMKQVN